jgi:hypothetical protein
MSDLVPASPAAQLPCSRPALPSPRRVALPEATPIEALPLAREAELRPSNLRMVIEQAMTARGEERLGHDRLRHPGHARRLGALAGHA